MKFFEYELKLGYYKVTDVDLNFIHTKQDHSNIIYSLSQVKNAKDLLQGDGIYWRWDEITKDDKIAVYTADCLPIVLEGENGGSILHAGWRGVHQKIHQCEVLKGLKIQRAIIGPSIQVNQFEVTEEFYKHFPSSSHFIQSDSKHFFNLQAQVKDDLKSFFPSIDIIDSELCTFENIQYNSYRRSKTQNRNYNYYQLKE